jgi:hypothetical protein
VTEGEFCCLLKVVCMCVYKYVMYLSLSLCPFVSVRCVCLSVSPSLLHFLFALCDIVCSSQCLVCLCLPWDGMHIKIRLCRLSLIFFYVLMSCCFHVVLDNTERVYECLPNCALYTSRSPLQMAG